mgnify:CR=1 FL=1
MFKCSHAVLSMIFGILGKFGIGIGNQIFLIGYFFVDKKIQNIFVENNFWSNNNFWVEKNLIEKKVGRKKFDRKKIIFSMIFFSTKKFSTNFFFDQTIFDPKNIFRPNIFFDKNVLDFFSTKKLSIKKCWLPIPIPNFPKIPKIALRTACEH